MAQPSWISHWKTDEVNSSVFSDEREQDQGRPKMSRPWLVGLGLLLVVACGCGNTDRKLTAGPSAIARPQTDQPQTDQAEVTQPPSPDSANDPSSTETSSSHHSLAPQPAAALRQHDLSLADSQACTDCHQEQASSYARSGMASSWRSVPAAIAATFVDKVETARVSDPTAGYLYEIAASEQQVTQTELHPDQPEHRLMRRAEYAVGSGKRAIAWLAEDRGYLTQLPVARFHPHSGSPWRLNPGYELGNHRFDRPITPGCVACHATGANHQWPTENRYSTPVRAGIACQRCHGLAGEHIAFWRNTARPTSPAVQAAPETAQKKSAAILPVTHATAPEPALLTAENQGPAENREPAENPLSAKDQVPAESSSQIENPAMTESRLPAESQSPGSDRFPTVPTTAHTATANLTAVQANDLCLQCHLQGDVTVPAGERSPLDFRAGDRLAEHRQDYQIQAEKSRGAGASVASHGAAFLQSRCYTESLEQPSADPASEAKDLPLNLSAEAVRPHLRTALTCLHCHDPHHPATDFDSSYYDSRCATCHQRNDCRGLPTRPSESDSCVGCHMPQRQTREGLHVMVTDHRILARPDKLEARSPDQRPLPPRAETFTLRRLQPAAVPQPHELGAAYVRLHETMPPQPRALERAIPWLAERVRVEPRDLESRYWLGSALVASGRGAEAVDALRGLVEHAPHRLDARLRLAAAYELAGRPAEAADQYVQLVRAAPAWMEPYPRLAQLLLSAQRPDVTRGLLEQQRQYQETPLGLANLGLATRLTGGSQQQAIRYLDQARQLAPRLAQIDLLRAAVHLLDNNTDQARQALRRILTYEPQHAEALASLRRLNGG